jgi:hypothetical protein
MQYEPRFDVVRNLFDDLQVVIGREPRDIIGS